MPQTVPFRADHVGSLLRPPQLLAAREQAKAGRMSAAELKTVEDEAVRRAARMQEELGLSGITDGELLQGRVVKLHDKDVIVDFGYKSEGLVPIEQFTQPDGSVASTGASAR